MLQKGRYMVSGFANLREEGVRIPPGRGKQRLASMESSVNFWAEKARKRYRCHWLFASGIYTVLIFMAEVKRFELLRRRSRPTGFRIMLLTRNMTESRRRKMYLMEPETHLKNGRLFSSLCFFSRNLVNRKWIEQQDITAPTFWFECTSKPARLLNFRL